MPDNGFRRQTTTTHEGRTGDHEVPVAQLVTQLSEQSTALARMEVELAKLELAQKAKRAGLGAGMFGGAGLFGLGLFGALTACFILAFNLILPAWAAAFVVAGLYAMVAGGLALSGKSNLRRGIPPVPKRAVESTKEDVQWMRHRAKSAKS